MDSSQTRYDVLKHAEDHDLQSNQVSHYPEHSTSKEVGFNMITEKSDRDSLQRCPDRVDSDSSREHTPVVTLRDRINRFWIWEIATSLFALGCMGVVAWTLAFLNNKPMSSWKIGMTPNSFISTFVTGARFLMLIGVAEGIAQLRWMYYLDSPKRLDHLDSFDSASRGAWGCLLFLLNPSIKGRIPLLARFGAILIIMSLAMDPVTQQILSYDIRLYKTPNEAVWMPVTSEWYPDGTTVLDDSSIRRAIFGGLLGLETPYDYGCPGSDCSWADFSSLGYCSSCANVADTAIQRCLPGYGLLSTNCTQVEYQVPNLNMSIVLQNGSQPTTVSDGAPDGGSQFTILKSVTSGASPRGLQSPDLFDFVTAQLLADPLGVSDGNLVFDRPAWNLTACTLSWCAKVYEGVRVSNGTLLNDQPRNVALVSLNTSHCWDEDQPTCQQLTNSSALPASSNTTFNVGTSNSTANVRNLLVFDYNVTRSASGASNALQAAYNLPVTMLWNTNITTQMSSVVDKMTKFIRSAPAVSQHVTGTLDIRDNFVDVSYGWFSFPATLILLSLLFIGTVIFMSVVGHNVILNGEGEEVTGTDIQRIKEKVIWKSTTLPLLLHGLEDWNNPRHQGYKYAETTGAITRTAESMRAQLRRNAEGEIRFVRC